MAPKNKGKKAKKVDDDFWESAGQSVAGNNAQDDPAYAPQAGALNTEAASEGEGDDFGGLMSAIKANQGQKKEKKKTAAVEPEAKEEGDVDDDAAEGAEGAKVLSKKEKEKLKKEKEKARKKAQAAAKKGQTSAAPEPDASVSEPLPTAETPAAVAALSKADNENEENDAEDGEGDANKKKKKKKKAKKEDEPAPAPTKKKGTSGISALKALMEEKRRLEEEARLKEEEERRRIEEEERRAEEEEKRKEEEKQRKKEKEKAKRELAKKEGRLLTKKQKDEQRAAEIRRQALIASGVQIEGLQQSATASKRPMYGNRRKGQGAKGASPAPESLPQTPEPPSAKELTPETEPEEKAVPADVEAAWDDDSDEDEEAAKPAPSQIEPPTAASKPASLAQANGGATANGKADPKSESEDSDSDSGSSSEESSSEEDSESDDARSKAQIMAAQRKAEAVARKAKAHEAAIAAGNKDDLRSPICCILGHVDTGKTKLLDKIRQTNVQEGEAGGITQQIGATYFPVDAIKAKTAVLNKDNTQEYKVPGLLVIDTPGHESFTNLRSRGSSLCNIAILVVDIMHGLEPQTLESLRLLRDRKTPFIVALNKIDRIYGWEPTPDGAFRESLAKQSKLVQREFEDRVQKTIVAFAEQGLNSVLYYDNKSFARNVSLVPTSAITGEGVPDMIMLLVNLTQQRMSDRLMYLSELECTVLEVKVVEGLGTTIDVVLSNGILRESDKIVVCGLNGPIVTQVRALLTPQPLRELRIKSSYVHHKEVKAALGVKLVAPDLEKAIAGSRLLVVGPDDDEDDLREEVMSDLTSLLNSIDKSGRGVCVQASTLGSLEALLDFLKVSKIPVSGINIGPVHKKDVMRAGTMLEKARELACILCFDVTVDRDAERMAEEMGIRLFKADIIYHLFDAFKAYNAEIVEAKRRDAAPMAVWPCRLKTIACFAKRDPIILGVDILDGTLRVGTPLCVVKTDPVTGAKEIVELGKITSLEINHKSMEVVKKSQAGGGVAVKIEHAVYQSAKMFGRHFDEKDELYSRITRQSIDVLKTSFKADVSNEEWLLIKALKPRLDIA
ncbi:hypothetical protein FA95DRAFT_1563785 [Auriscalpium vulgare]|uniref:Uncharacterized protein n=1 Tax=Auriscalpium vulgare TaxID=40419 RepID=A0ACB8RFK2_9AGAM|nr:hypothetical protein FA95DRAFT_1563785 [Auriscalpium vulgare]